MKSLFSSTTATVTAAVAGVGSWIAVPLLVIGIYTASSGGGGLAAVIAASGCGPGGGPGGGSVAADDGAYSAEQMTIARTIVDTTAARGLPRRAAVLAVATAMVESRLRNLDHGDADSLGVFQQRPSQGWGSPGQVRDPVYATNAFLDRLIRIDGWERLPDGVAEQKVQRSAHPERYASRHPEAEAIVAKFWQPTPDRGGASDRRATHDDTGADTGPGVEVVAACPDTDTGDTADDVRVTDRQQRQLPDGFTLPDDTAQRAAVSYVISQLGAPYVWGAKGPDSFDCSGLMMAAWAHAGVAISAGTLNQVHDGRPVPSIRALQPGDLVFIPGSLGTMRTPRHVGMYIGHGLIVNAYDSDTGVIVEHLSAWKHEIAAIRRVHTPTAPDPGEA